MNMTRSEFIEKLREVGPEAWHLYTVMMAYSVDNRCVVSQQQLMESLGIGKTALNNRIRKLRDNGLIEPSTNGAYGLRMPTGFTVQSTVVIKESNDINESNEITKELPNHAKWTAKDAMSIWQQYHQQTYGTDYKPGNWAREMSQLKVLMSRYDRTELERIFEVVFRMYAKRWYSQRYPRPTIGQMVSWLAAQAEAFAREEQSPQPVEIKTDDGRSIEEMMDEKGWI